MPLSGFNNPAIKEAVVLFHNRFLLQVPNTHLHGLRNEYDLPLQISPYLYRIPCKDFLPPTVPYNIHSSPAIRTQKPNAHQKVQPFPVPHMQIFFCFGTAGSKITTDFFFRKFFWRTRNPGWVFTIHLRYRRNKRLCKDALDVPKCLLHLPPLHDSTGIQYSYFITQLCYYSHIMSDY